MDPDEHNYLERVMARHGLKENHAQHGYLIFEKPGVRVQAELGGETIELHHDGTEYLSPSVEDLDDYMAARNL